MTSLNILSGGAAQGLVASLGPKFKAQTGLDIAGEFGAVGAMADKLRNGTEADIVILTAAIVGKLGQENRVVGASIADIGLVETAMAVRAGDPTVSVGDAAASGQTGVASGLSRTGMSVPDGIVALSSIVRVSGVYAGVIRNAIGDAWIADSYERAANASRLTPLAVVTRDGDVFRGPYLVTGGLHEQARGILETKGEIKDLRGRIQAERDGLLRLGQETGAIEAAISQATNAIAALAAEHHKQEKAVVAHDARLQHAVDEATEAAKESPPSPLEVIERDVWADGGSSWRS